MKRWWLFYGLKILICMLIGALALGFIVMKLWNWILPDVFHAPGMTITFIQALGLLALSRILFSGFSRWGCRHHGCGVGKREHWKNKFKARFESMSPEEKEKFKSHYKKCCNWVSEEEEPKPGSQAL
jgi:Ca2+/H+ antiporter, TMEM165/GDT1 family